MASRFQFIGQSPCFFFFFGHPARQPGSGCGGGYWHLSVGQMSLAETVWVGWDAACSSLLLFVVPVAFHCLVRGATFASRGKAFGKEDGVLARTVATFLPLVSVVKVGRKGRWGR
ncbi:hypothetical protein, unlikely [Trypanosoma brucei gambiense DAL972]|uniref:Uncharacterized protein n=1 Tax=Trypanosoma brucei gambiense (strain MHOM/CI/86/DAL972) TaxID=679716 RepID=D0A8I4_TRYB9|nr:hypothetical protein, unlikely [Trypanosoma brucei gambiense DAL972]CBH17985.1 hypothetical protein, unlikely [Trypanosoma brucei gambiense DAL972]|eukprot:XP_011780249.1 hypothetical protein, unlikely [Trypanosoma brucei gambiense DAL972]